MYTFSKQWSIRLIKGDSEDIYNVAMDFVFIHQKIIMDLTSQE